MALLILFKLFPLPVNLNFTLPMLGRYAKLILLSRFFSHSLIKSESQDSPIPTVLIVL